MQEIGPEKQNPHFWGAGPLTMHGWGLLWKTRDTHSAVDMLMGCPQHAVDMLMQL